MFEMIHREGKDDWVVVHSLGLLRHDRKPWAEADFVVICQRGVFVLEVKGGDITRRGREWFTNGRPLKESPFDQAAGAAAALYRALKPICPFIAESIVGSGVCFPEVDFRARSVDLDRSLIWDAESRDRSFVSYIDGLADYWRGHLGPRAFERRPLSPSDRDAVVEAVAGDFEVAAVASRADRWCVCRDGPVHAGTGRGGTWVGRQ